MTIRDIKIRKVNPQQKITKQSLRFQTAHQILDSSININQNILPKQNLNIQ